MINSILDTDLYKLTMQQAVCQKFPHAQARFEFINRGRHKFTEAMAERIKLEINNMDQLKLTHYERHFLEETCPYLTPVYRDFLNGYRYDIEEVTVSFENDELKIVIEGPWYRTILWEVPLMAIISEVYNRETYPEYTYDGQKDAKKFRDMEEADVYFADFGTRRRLNYNNHNRIVAMAISAKTFVGTSNVHFACRYGAKPIGTHAHEWFMFHGAQYGYKVANHTALKNWSEVYQGDLGIALTDTYTTKAFFDDFYSIWSREFDGVRHDSGDPFSFADDVITHYETHGIDPMSKTIVFSDGLTVDKAIEIKEYCTGKIKCSFGIGTHLTNNIEGITPLNMVIKMTACKRDSLDTWLPTVKLSDVTGKHTGNKDAIDLCMKTLNIL